jgi:hypothetical protein
MLTEGRQVESRRLSKADESCDWLRQIFGFLHPAPPSAQNIRQYVSGTALQRRFAQPLHPRKLLTTALRGRQSRDGSGSDMALFTTLADSWNSACTPTLIIFVQWHLANLGVTTTVRSPFRPITVHEQTAPIYRDFFSKVDNTMPVKAPFSRKQIRNLDPVLSTTLGGRHSRPCQSQYQIPLRSSIRQLMAYNAT